MACFAMSGKTKLTPEQVLCEAGIVYDKSCVSEECYNMYLPEALSVDPIKYKSFEPMRQPEFTLVTGSSGSGKTLFAIRRVPNIIFEEKESQYFRIHFTAKTVTDLISKKATSKKATSNLDFPQAVACIVRDVITRILVGKGYVDVEDLNIPLHVTIDDAGDERFTKFLDTGGKISFIHQAIDDTFRFKKVHVTVVGTRLETSSTYESSCVETIKFRMQPWTAAKFDALVDQSSNENKNRVKEVVREFVVLEALISNARCACFVLRSMSNVSFLDKSHVENFVPVVVSAVADMYIGQTELKDLKDAEDKWKVARAVFLELDKAISQPDLAFFPEFKSLESETLRDIGNSLLDINVESINGMPSFGFRSETYAISMSPAIAIVLTHLLTAEAEALWDWQKFESMVMLSELKQMVVDSQETPSQLDKLVIVLQSPVPDAAGTKSVSIPEMNRFTVMLNGSNAEYADVVAPYRLTRAKITTDFKNPPALDLQDELNKMGVTNSTEHALQRFTTLASYTMWETGKQVDSAMPPLVAIQAGNNQDPRFKCYPYSARSPHAKRFADPTMIVGSFDESTGWTVPDMVFGKNGISTAFSKERPVTAVFATNGCEYRFETSRFTITPDDVDCNGSCCSEKSSPSNFRISCLPC